MYLLFPNLQTLQIALTSGLVPEVVAAAPAEFALSDEGQIWVKASRKIEATRQDELKQLGVSFRKSTRGASSPEEAVTCWPQILPLEKIPQAHTQQEGLGERTPVLFVLPESASLADVVSEMLRLGNDRQSFRQQKTDAGVRTLLLVKGPPYYTLLRAIDRLDGAATPRAYVEQSPGVWVELGYQHPLAKEIQPAKGTFLLLGHPREWTAIAEGKFHDIYEALRFTIPGKPLRWETKELDEKLKVRLRLVRGGTEDPAEFWVLNESGISQLEELVKSEDDRLVSRLAFAVGTSSKDAGPRTVIVKIRPGKEPPPVLVLDGIACRSYLRLPNLFLPIGYRLHPPLRRDAVKQLLAGDGNHNTWLLPGEDGQFIPQSLPDNAFRPLTDWVDYVVDSNRDALTAWSEAMQFDFESFVCPDEESDRSTKVQKPKRETEKRGSSSQVTTRSAKAVTQKTKPEGSQPRQEEETVSRRTALLPPSELQVRLAALEDAFREMPEPIHSPARQNLWWELAETNMALGHKAEGALCFVNGIWDEAVPSADWIREWYEAELSGDSVPPMSGDEFQAALSTERPTPTQLNLLAIHVIAAAFAEPHLPGTAHEVLSSVQRQLEQFENFLPLRTAWLAWLACAKIAHDDVLALARTRDRVLERLHEYGPSPEMDLPGFLRSTGPRTGDRFRAVKQAMSELRDRVQPWIKRELERQPSSGKGQTAAYADLMIAYGYARVGLRQECEDLLQETEAKLLSPPVRNEVHEWFLKAFRHRVSQSLEGQSPSGTLPDELTRPLIEKTIDLGWIYAIDSLRQKSRIIQPYEQIDSRTRFLDHKGTKGGDLATELERLSDIEKENRVELAEGIQKLLETHRGDAILKSYNLELDNQALLTGLMQFAPRLGDSQASQLLEQVPGTLDQLTEPGQQAAILERALIVAAHFGHPAQVRHFVEQLHSLFETESSPDTAEAFATLLGQSFRGLRKLGMRGEISSLLDHIDRLDQDKRFEASVSSSPRVKKTKATRRANAEKENQLVQELNTLTLRLNIAAGWFYFGNDDRAEKILKTVSRFLYQENALKSHLKRKLVRRYAQVLEQAPIELAIPKLQEVFHRLTGISKGLGAGLHDDHYAYEFLEVIDSIVLALASDEMSLDPKSREIMDDLEFSIRQRIHRDLERAQRASEV